MQKATERMNTGDGGLAKHASTCQHEVDWENAKIIGRERRWTQRKYLEGIESLRQKNKKQKGQKKEQKGVIPLNSYNQLEQWQPILYPLFEK